MKENVRKLIEEYVDDYQKKYLEIPYWRKPIVKFGDANDLKFRELKNTVIDSHQLPEDIIDNPSIVVSYFIPFNSEVENSNRDKTKTSQLWADAYYHTNEIFKHINKYLVTKLEEIGYSASFSNEAGVLSDDLLYSNWSQRHVAEICGLGKFGMNRMLITESGCCGRFGSIVTNLDVEPDKEIESEYCLYKHNKSCKLCIDHCPIKALTIDSFDRLKCHDVCLSNKEKLGLDVCGKCDVNIPCAFKSPVL